MPIGPSLTRHFPLGPKHLIWARMPCPGQCLNLGRVPKNKIAEIVALHGDAVSMVWQIACTLQKVLCARKTVGEVEVRGTRFQLSPSSYGSSRLHLNRRRCSRQQRRLIHPCHTSQQLSSRARY